VYRVVAAGVIAFLACLAGPASGHAEGALPGWLPIGTVDKAFNDAANDLSIAQRFALRQCADHRRYFACSYASTTGIGILAWAPRSEGLVEQLTIAIPRCQADAGLAEISAMLVHIFSPRRPQTFARPIPAMLPFAAGTGSNEHWLDGVKYVLINRGPKGLGVVVHRTPKLPDLDRSSPARRSTIARQTNFYLPQSFECRGIAN
jgi:hypothetical protein